MCHLREAASSHIHGATTARALQNRPDGLIGGIVGSAGRQEERLYLLRLRRCEHRRRGLHGYGCCYFPLGGFFVTVYLHSTTYLPIGPTSDKGPSHQ